MSNLKDMLKQRVRESTSSAHNQLIETVDSAAAADSTKNVNVNVNVNVNKSRKLKFEDKFSRATVFIENDLLQQLEKLAEKGKGEKTRIVNEALREWLKNNGHIS